MHIRSIVPRCLSAALVLQAAAAIRTLPPVDTPPCESDGSAAACELVPYIGSAKRALPIGQEGCPWYDDGERFSCPGAMTSPRLGKELEAQVQGLVRNNVTMYFIGDSLSGQHADAVACRLHAMGHRLEQGTKVPAFQLSGLPGTLHVMPTIAALAPELRQGDIIVANEGVWWRTSRRQGELDVEEIAAEALDAEALRALAVRGVMVLWRETAAQHFPTENGTYGTWYAGGKHCMPIEYPGWMIGRNAKIDAIVTGKGIPIIPTFNSSLSAVTDHLELKTPHTSRGLDCTHFCTPSGVLDEWVDLTFEVIAAVRL